MAPGELPPDTYPIIELTSGMGLTIHAGGPIQQVFIAPPIHPIQYEFGHDTVEPLGDSFDYYGEWSHCSTESIAEFYNPGVYTIKVDYVDPLKPDFIVFLEVDSHQLGPTIPSLSRFRHVVLPPSSQGALVIEEPNRDNGAIAVSLGVAIGEVRAATTEEVINNLNAAYAAGYNQPLQVVLIGHGRPSALATGAGQDLPLLGKTLLNDNADVVDFGAALRGRISHLTLWGCCVANGLDNPPLLGGHVMQNLHFRLRDQQPLEVNAYDQVVSVVGDSNRERSAYFVVPLHAAWKQVIG